MCKAEEITRTPQPPSSKEPATALWPLLAILPVGPTSKLKCFWSCHKRSVQLCTHVLLQPWIIDTDLYVTVHIHLISPCCTTQMQFGSIFFFYWYGNPPKMNSDTCHVISMSVCRLPRWARIDWQVSIIQSYEPPHMVPTCPKHAEIILNPVLKHVFCECFILWGTATTKFG